MAKEQINDEQHPGIAIDTTERMQLARELPRRTVALILAGDFALSNCINSGIRRIGVLTQYKSHSLLRHLQRGWNFLRGEANEFIDLLPAQQRVNEAFWYRGTSDAIYQNIDILRSYQPEYIRHARQAGPRARQHGHLRVQRRRSLPAAGPSARR